MLGTGSVLNLDMPFDSAFPALLSMPAWSAIIQFHTMIKMIHLCLTKGCS